MAGAGKPRNQAISAAIEDAKAADLLTLLWETRIPHLLKFIDFASWHTLCSNQDVIEKRMLVAVFRKVHLITVCAWCKSTQNADGFWRHAENAPKTDAETAVSHGICPDCAEKSYDAFRLATFPTLFGQMRWAVNEASAITEEAEILIRASKPTEHVDDWRQIREQWESTRQKWLAAAASLKNHLATTPGHAHLNEHGPVYASQNVILQSASGEQLTDRVLTSTHERIRHSRGLLS